MTNTLHVGLLLAAGASRRFGPENKLLAPLWGRPLIAHAADAMRGAHLARRIAVTSDPALTAHLDGFEVVLIAQGQQSDSLLAGLSVAGRPDRLLIALGDMPLISPDLLQAVLGRCTDDAASASRDGHGPPMPPACFPAGWLPRLAMLGGDQGAGHLLRDLPDPQIVDATGCLPDIDTTEALSHLAKAPPISHA